MYTIVVSILLISSEWCAGTLGGEETLCAEPVRGTLFFCVSSSFFSLSEKTFGCAYAHESTYETAMMKENNGNNLNEFSTVM